MNIWRTIEIHKKIFNILEKNVKGVYSWFTKK